MSDPADADHRQISDYERAVCYYAYSGASANVTLALILVYALCLVEAAAALAYGYFSGDQTWTTVGTVALGGMIVFGVVAFSFRALMADIRRRRTLAIANCTPEPESVKGLPDPFADHALLRRPADEGREGFEITDRDGKVRYRVALKEDGRLRVVHDAEGKEAITVRIPQFTRSFALGGMLPRRVEVLAGEETIGRIRQRFTLGAPLAEIIEGRVADGKRYSLRETGIFQGHRLVGRIYLLRDHAYLDIEEAALGKTLIGLLAALSYEKAQTALL